MEFETDPNGDWQYCHSRLFGDLSALVSHLPYFEVRSINGVDYVVLSPKFRAASPTARNFLTPNTSRFTAGDTISRIFYPTANAWRTFPRCEEVKFDDARIECGDAADCGGFKGGREGGK